LGVDGGQRFPLKKKKKKKKQKKKKKKKRKKKKKTNTKKKKKKKERKRKKKGKCLEKATVFSIPKSHKTEEGNMISKLGKTIGCKNRFVAYLEERVPGRGRMQR